MESQTLFVRPPVWAIFTVVVVAGCFYLGGKVIETKDHTPTLVTVSGEGKATAVPDIALLQLGVQTGQQKTAAVAMQLVRQKMNAVFTAVKGAGVDEKDITTANFSLNPQYDWTSGTQIIIGYEASESLEVKVRNLDNASTVLEAATTAGANQAGDVQFTIDNPETVRAQARAQAIEQAQAKAATLAVQLGMRLGKVKSFQESGATPPPVMYMAKSMAAGSAADAAPAVPLPAGQQDVTASVSVSYELY